ncbi:hypothetical protein Tsubulata_005735 [Turnera subulata]|uniref:Cell wall hydroxyproline-rich glycoprotein n=1 Tax=Turnera subulata TaxID=218843 RepID=A0A9Q0G9E7_9ROSI|nr:hypothetical protein Tsubulata_005735 [Turnera subulata]
MASSSLLHAMAGYLLLLLLLHLSFLTNNPSAKHGHSPHHRRHRSHSHSPTSNVGLRQAYIALQAWKRVIYSDPLNFIANWVGTDVCSYSGIYCTASPHDPKIQVVAGIDLNSADIAGFLPDELGLLTDLALIHLNSNRFCGIIPQSIENLTLLYELDLSNNRFVGPFPSPVLSLPMLNYLDLRYNEFEGPLPPQLFQKKLDAIFVNNNRFTNSVPAVLSGSTASVVVIANNNFQGCLPPSIANFADTLEELLITNTNLTGCLPPEVGYLYKLRVLDVSRNDILGPIPYSLAGLAHLEILNLGHNRLTGVVPQGVCILPNLGNLTVSYNYFCEEEGICMNMTARGGIKYDDRRNCLPEKPLQRSEQECNAVLEHPVDCFLQKCVQGVASGTGFLGSPTPPPPAFASAPAPMAAAATPLLSPTLAPSHT